MPAKYQVKRIYRYDELNRLVSAGDENGREINYVYDPAGNRLPAAQQEGGAFMAGESPAFHELEQQYSRLMAQVEQDLLTAEEFVKRVNTELRFQAPDGRWWQMQAADGSWLVWDGQKWVKDRPYF